jgi:hypothetical protein
MDVPFANLRRTVRQHEADVLRVIDDRVRKPTAQSSASVVLPAPNPPLIQMITGLR